VGCSIAEIQGIQIRTLLIVAVGLDFNVRAAVRLRRDLKDRNDHEL
jgi:hypothetical protein